MMLRRVARILPWLLMAAASAVVAGSALPAAAQAAVADEDDHCYACHEQLYRLHDIGKAFCLCGAPMECTCCHGGNAGEVDADAAHAGMVANPLREQAPACQECHPDDSEARRAIFATRAGVSATPCPTMEAIVNAIVPPPAPAGPAGLDPWRIAALSLLGGALLALMLFAYRCWKADCLARGTKA